MTSHMPLTNPCPCFANIRANDACVRPILDAIDPVSGLWRSLVARPSGGRKVAGSSPASPTNNIARVRKDRAICVSSGAINIATQRENLL